ncbi:hypothetical protein DIPPA_27735 [Diplonema papillatum]|nr:hypothetical protein DIPPA_27735 [Diplonema papillatum]
MFLAARIVFALDESGGPVFERRYPTVEVRGQRLCQLHGVENAVIPPLPELCQAVARSRENPIAEPGEREYVTALDNRLWPVVQVRLPSEGIILCLVPLVAHLGQAAVARQGKPPTLSPVVLAGSLTVLSDLCELSRLVRSAEPSLPLAEVADRLLLYVSTMMPLGTPAEDTKPARWLRRFGYQTEGDSPAVSNNTTEVTVQQVELLHGDLGTDGGPSAPSVTGKLEAHVRNVSPYQLSFTNDDNHFDTTAGRITLTGKPCDCALSPDVQADTVEKGNTTLFDVLFMDGSNTLVTFIPREPPSPTAVKAVFKAYPLKAREASTATAAATPPGTMDIKLQISVNLAPLDAFRKTARTAIDVVLNFGAESSVAAQTLTASGGVVCLVTASELDKGVSKNTLYLTPPPACHGGSPDPGRKCVHWKLPAIKKPIESFSLSGRCTFASADQTATRAFLSDVNCFADISLSAVGYKPCSGTFVAAAAFTSHPGGDRKISVAPPVMRSAGLRVWNSKAREPAQARLP